MDNFYRTRGYPSYRCKECTKAQSRRRHAENRQRVGWSDVLRERGMRTRYGIGMAEYQAQLQLQSHACRICNVPLSEDRRLTHIDHDHATGVFRGILCVRCNTLVGYIETTPADVLAKAQAYVVRST